MVLRDTIHHMNQLLTDVSRDLGKVAQGNKTAAKRARTGSIKLAKIAKLFRKESIAAEKNGQIKRKPKNGKLALCKRGAKKASRKKRR